MNSSPPIVSELVLVGGGHAHVHVLKMLGMPHYRQLLWEQGIRVTLIAKDIQTPYSGMLPGFVSGHYSYDQIHLDLQKLCRFSNIRVVHAACTGIDYHPRHTNNNTNNNNNGGGGGGFLHIDDGRPPIRYDALSLDIGSSPGATHQSIIDHPRIIPVKPISNFCAFYQRLQAHLRTTSTAKKNDGSVHHRVCIVGGGAGGIELALSVQYNLQQVLRKYRSTTTTQLELVVITRGSSLLESHNAGVQRIMKRVLSERNVKVHLNSTVVRAEEGTNGGQSYLILQDESAERIPFDDCLWCTSAAGPTWLSQKTPFACDSTGFVQVADTYQVLNHPGVFAAGDCCHMVQHPRPKAGVFAVRAGPPLVDNLIRYLTDQPLKAVVPQSNFLGLLSTGDQYAIASKGQYFSLEGRWVWKWKDWIDRVWMAKYTTDLPDVEEMMTYMTFERKRNAIPTSIKSPSVLEAFASDPMRCGGCGAKVGSTTLSRVLKALHQRQVERAKERNLPPPPPMDHDDAAISPIPSGNNGGAMVNTIDYFRSLIDDPYLFGKIVAVHSLSDVHAMGATAQSALSLAVVPFAADEAITESTLLQLLAGVADILQDEGVQLSGGHTCEGTELACGVAVQGYAPNPDQLLRKRGGRVGDQIVLTKPLGTGALFAADMRAKCKGEYVMEAVQSMVVSNGPASRVAMVEASGVRACTDVTGFGFMGHMLEMLLANDEIDELPTIGATLSMQDVPFLRGGLEASSQAIFSSLQPQNIRNRRAVQNHEKAAKKYPIQYPLLFDPQTAGGLLMFVDPDRCEALLKNLEEEDIPGVVIGEIVSHDVGKASSDASPKESGEAFVCTVGGGTGGMRIQIV
jgi:selenide,water dikinase